MATRQEKWYSLVNLAYLGKSTVGGGGYYSEETKKAWKRNQWRFREKSAVFCYLWGYCRRRAPCSPGSSLLCVPWSTWSGSTAAWPAANAVTQGRSCRKRQGMSLLTRREKWVEMKQIIILASWLNSLIFRVCIYLSTSVSFQHRLDKM